MENEIERQLFDETFWETCCFITHQFLNKADRQLTDQVTHTVRNQVVQQVWNQIWAIGDPIKNQTRINVSKQLNNN